MLRVADKKNWGKILVAEQDLLPGTELFRDEVLLEWAPTKPEQSPLLLLIQQYMEGYQKYASQFTAEQKASYLRLSTQNRSPIIEAVRQIFHSSDCRSPEDNFEGEQFLQTAIIARQRSFVVDNFNRRPVFATASLLRHSCAPNCYLEFQRNHCVCRVISPVRRGEELTAPVSEEILWDTTANRREFLLEVYDFTCHCRRCDAEGDDTRQFKCFDAGCTGYHLACAPRIQREPRYTSYTGVKYVEPQLLPCTVCQRSPPLEYQARMFDYEHCMRENYITFSGFRGRPAGADPERKVEIAALLNHMRIPLQRHVYGLRQALLEFIQIRRGPANCAYYGIDPSTRTLELANEVEATFDLSTHFPCFVRYGHVTAAVQAYASIGRHEQAVTLARRILRAHRIREGRDRPSYSYKAEAETIAAALTASLVKVSAASTAVPEGCCVYCGESLEHAAMKRSRCGVCKQVIYCGAACQKAHWPAHKKACKRSGSSVQEGV